MVNMRFPDEQAAVSAESEEIVGILVTPNHGFVVNGISFSLVFSSQ
jgi:hypothetical protein